MPRSLESYARVASLWREEGRVVAALRVTDFQWWTRLRVFSTGSLARKEVFFTPNNKMNRHEQAGSQAESRDYRLSWQLEFIGS